MVCENIGHTKLRRWWNITNEMRMEGDTNGENKKDDKMEIPPHGDVLKQVLVLQYFSTCVNISVNPYIIMLLTNILIYH